MARRSTWGAVLLALALVSAAPADTTIDNGDGTTTVVRDDGSWFLMDAAGNVLEDGQMEGTSSGGGEEPGYGGVEGPEPGAPGEAPVEECRQVETLCDPDDFKQNASKFFWLYYCPSACGWSAYSRITEVIDDAWLFVSDRFGSLYGTGQIKGYVYTTGQHYSDQSGGAPWSGGFFSPSTNQIHVPAPLGRRGWSLKALLVHELTHFRLHKLTHSSATGEGSIGNWRFLNEGLAQVMEQKLFEDEPPPAEAGIVPQRRQSLWDLKRRFEAGMEFQPLKQMMFRVGNDVGFFYAQSWAVASYIEHHYGTRAMDRLLETITQRTTIEIRTWTQAESHMEEVLKAALGTDAESLRKGAEDWARLQVAREFR